MCRPLAATEVEAEGRAVGDQRTAREQALADALREAVRVGGGVDVVSSSGVTDFALDCDRILTRGDATSKNTGELGIGEASDGSDSKRLGLDLVLGNPKQKSDCFDVGTHLVFVSFSKIDRAFVGLEVVDLSRDRLGI